MNKTITITFPDGNQREYPAGITGEEIAKSISHKLAKNALAVKFNGKVIELWRPIETDGELQILTFDDPEGKEVFWHSTAHLMAQAIKRKFPQAQLGIGPPIENGFYYDILLDRPITPEDFEDLEAEMAAIVEKDYPITRKVLSRDEALKFFSDIKENLKIELINDLPEEAEITAYSQGEFTDLCRGPHVPSTGKLGKNFKLLSVAGAYWRGDEKRQQLQRLYAINFPKRQMLEEYLKRIEEARKRDHRKLGKELDLFSFHSESAGAGFAYWHPRGALVRTLIENFLREEQEKRGYQFVVTPHLVSAELYKTSGHYEWFLENMYPVNIEDEEFFIKPMNCPCHIKIFETKLHSYRDLPVRLAEFGTVYRYEKSGVLHGLLRVRGFTQDDAHIFCTEEQLNDEIIGVLELLEYVMNSFGFNEFKIELSVWDPQNTEKYAGEPAEWERAEQALVNALNQKGWEYSRHEGEAAFYGPKIDVKVVDALGRLWQCGTVQFDFNLPRRFNLKYIGSDGNAHMPYMVHRALVGSIERFVGVLLENYGGQFPLWLAPTQVVVLPITDKHLAYAKNVAEVLKKGGIRVEVDERNEKVGFKIREAEVGKVPYMVIVGDNEIANNEIAVRQKGTGNLGAMSPEAFLNKLIEEVKQKSNE
jgi:threonyl-tRNA synthetase